MLKSCTAGGTPVPPVSRRKRRTGGVTLSPQAGAPTVNPTLVAARPVDTSMSLPPMTAEELRSSAELHERLREMATQLRQNNLDNAVKLAIEAAAGRGELIDHFAELGRRFGHTIGAAKPRPVLRLVGGKQA
jgi:hypothetical protein